MESIIGDDSLLSTRQFCFCGSLVPFWSLLKALKIIT